MPIQIGKYRSVSFSLRITTCCPLGMCTRMESTCISTNLAILNSSLSYHRVFHGQTAFVRFGHSGHVRVCGLPARLNFGSGGDPKEAAARPYRRPLTGLSSLLCAALPDRPGRQYRQRRLRLYLDAPAGLAGTPGLRARVFRSGWAHVPARGAGPVQGDSAADAARAEPAIPVNA